MNTATTLSTWTLTAEHRPTGTTLATVTLRDVTEREAGAAGLALLLVVNSRLRDAGDDRRCSVAMAHPALPR